MSFKPVVDLDCSTTTVIGGRDKKTGKHNPASIEGYYLGSKSIESKLGMNSLHVLQTQTGNVGVWGKTNLNQKMKVVIPGQMVRISFEGMIETKFNPMFKYKVEVDAENTVDVSTLESSSPSDAVEGYETAGEAEDDDNFYSSSASPTQAGNQSSFNFAAPSATKGGKTPSPEQIKTVQNLLSGGRRPS